MPLVFKFIMLIIASAVVVIYAPDIAYNQNETIELIRDAKAHE